MLITEKNIISKIREYLGYDPDTGDLFWKKQKGAAKKLSVAGFKYRTGVQLRFDKRSYPGSHIIWVVLYGKFPNGVIDHIDHNPLNNRIENLRDVSHQDNLKNMSLKNNNTSGICGVSFSKERKKWLASIRVNGIVKSLGRYTKIEDAIKARKKAESNFNFHKNHGANKWQ